MDHRNPRPVTSTDDEDEAIDGSSRSSDGRRLASRFGPTTVRLRSDRIGLIVGLMALVVLAAGWGSVRHWLATHPDRRIPFSAIELEPPPPASIPGGRLAILEDVRAKAGLGESIDALDIDLKELRKAFTHHSPWVREAVVRRSHPARIVVELAYREPVAVVEFHDLNRKKQPIRVVVDRDAVVLPIEPQQLVTGVATLPILSYKTPTVLRPGQAIEVQSEAGSVPADLPLIRACHLANFIAQRRDLVLMLGLPDKIWINSTDEIFIIWPGSKFAHWPTESDLNVLHLDDAALWTKLAEWAKTNTWPMTTKSQPYHLKYGLRGWQLVVGKPS